MQAIYRNVVTRFSNLCFCMMWYDVCVVYVHLIASLSTTKMVPQFRFTQFLQNAFSVCVCARLHKTVFLLTFNGFCNLSVYMPKKKNKRRRKSTFNDYIFRCCWFCSHRIGRMLSIFMLPLYIFACSRYWSTWVQFCENLRHISSISSQFSWCVCVGWRWGFFLRSKQLNEAK